MKIGTTTFGFRYLLQDPLRAPPLSTVVDRARSCGLECLQICENARPLELSAGEWKALLSTAAALGLEIQLGCKTLDPEVLARTMERAAMIPSGTVRIVLEEDGGPHPSRESIAQFLDRSMPRLEAFGMKLAIENHFDIPCRVLAEVAGAYPPARVGFCIDAANSLRNFEPAGRVFDLLGPRAVYYHLKDYRVHGTNVGFSVEGAPLGTGDLDLGGVIDRILAIDVEPQVFIENWVPASGDREADIEADRRWLEESLANLVKRLPAHRYTA